MSIINCKYFVKNLFIQFNCILNMLFDFAFCFLFFVSYIINISFISLFSPSPGSITYSICGGTLNIKLSCIVEVFGLPNDKVFCC